MQNLHVPLPDPLYKRLRKHSTRSNRPATVLAREAIDRWLDEEERRLLKEAISEYARAAAGTPEDLDKGFEAAGIESWLKEAPYEER